jgi:hypothetical protein
LSVRTSKSEIAIGLTHETVERARSTDPRWLVNGQWGMVQFLEKP